MEVSIFNENYVRPNSLRAWFLAARPKTLSGAAVPVMIGTAAAWHDYYDPAKDLMMQLSSFHWVPVILCFLFAFIMQIDANFINDYYDCVRGKDTEERLGPKRACQQGWISLKAMRLAIGLTTYFGCLTGLPLMCWGGVQMSLVGIACVIFCYLYTTVFSSLGLGDVLVLLFFGLVPVCGTYWVTMPHSTADFFLTLPSYTIEIPWRVLLLSIACGLIVDTLLIINNYRDIDTDKKVGKKTLIVLIGKKNAEYLYLSIVAIALCIVLFLYGWTSVNMILVFGVYFLYISTWNKMRLIGKGKELNKVLGLTARNIFVYGILTCAVIILS